MKRGAYSPSKVKHAPAYDQRLDKLAKNNLYDLLLVVEDFLSQNSPNGER